MKKPTCLVLFSGGLDSRIAIKLLQPQAKVEAIFFLLPFGGGCCSDKFCAFRFCQKEKIKLHIIDVTKGKLFNEYIAMLKKPKYGRGSAFNPCIDCHLFMLKKAKQFADKNNINIIATGEVLNERPFSQHRKALMLINQELGIDILRPLSAKLLPPTKAEQLGLIDRNKLLDIQGRQRIRQMKLAKKYNITYPNPAGGCLLCELDYCKKLKLLLEKTNLNYNDILLLKIGRHFQASQIILGRNKEENLVLEKQAGIKIIPAQPGPTALLKSEKTDKEKLVKNKKLIKQAKKLIQKYSKHKIKSWKIKN